MKPVIVGENNPYGGDPYYAMYPEPSNSAGGRMCRLVLGLDVDTYLERFERVNLLQAPKWSAPKAREAATELIATYPEDAKFILLGRKVFDGFMTKKVGNLPKVSHEWNPLAVFEKRFLALPHPSGLNRYWGAPGAFFRAREAVRSFLESK